MISRDDDVVQMHMTTEQSVSTSNVDASIGAVDTKADSDTPLHTAVPVTLDASLSKALRAASQRHGMDMSTIVLTAWAAVLARLSGQDVITMFTSIRTIERTCLLRVPPAATVIEWLQMVRQQMLDAHEHHVPLIEHATQARGSVRGMSYAPLCQVAFQWRDAGANASVSSVAAFDLTLQLNEKGSTFEGDLHYATALFDRATIERHVGYLQRMLTAMAGAEQHAVDRVVLLDETERQQVLYDFNATQAAYPHDKGLHELFEAQVACTPDAIAVVHDTYTLTYAALNRRANQLAHYLREQGVREDTRVAICAERGIALVIGIVAILKAGGGYVPLDPHYPAERLHYLLHDSDPVLVLTQGIGRDALAGSDITSVDLQDDSVWAHCATGDLPRLAGMGGDALAYVIYTSGSTGQPKGVEVPQRAVARLVINNGYADFNATDRVALAANPAFDASTMELWAPLLHGGTIIVIEQAVLLEPNRFAECLQHHRVSVMWLTVGLFNQYATALAGVIPQLRYLIVGGDALDPAVIGRVLREHPPQHLLNGYGPTETTTFAATYAITSVGEGDTSIPIGRPIGNTQVYILDAQRQPVPIGVTGELYIGGDGVAHGYRNRPDLTNERFSANPFIPGGRLYKTGDLGRWRHDGVIEYLGRNDFQVKIRGFRIELGEIEARLVSHPAVREAVVLARQDSPGDKRLVAYLTTADHPTPSFDDLRAHLAGTLPDYMIPAAYVVLDAFPLNPNGKLDRKALPAPDADAYNRRDYEAPLGGLEQTLAQIWTDVLKLERVGRSDNFFALGGHSLLAVMLTARVRSQLQRDLPTKDVFAYPVLHNLATLIGSLPRTTQTAIVPVSRDSILPLSFAQQRLWFLAQMEGGSEAYHIPMSLRLSGQLDRVALQRALDRIVARHEPLRTTFASSNSAPTQRIGASDTGFVLQTHDLRGEPDIALAQARHIDDEALQPFDLQHGPLIRGRLLQLGDADYVLAITMHHIVSDGWSMGVLADELSALYRAYAAGQDDPLPPLAVQYADYAVWQRNDLDGQKLQTQGAYWQQTLTDAPALLALPTDRPRPAQQSYRGGRVPVTLDAALISQLKALGQRHGVTLYMLVLAAWSVVLSRLSNQDEVVIGTPNANRVRAEIEPLIGFFVNTQAVRVEVAGTVAQLLSNVRERALGAQAHQDLPFEQVVELINPPRSLAYTPIFQVMLAWQNNDARQWDLPGLSATVTTAGERVAKFDLVLELSEWEQSVVGGLSYATALFDRFTIERHIGYLHRVLHAIVADDTRALDRIELLDQSEWHHLQELGDNTQASYPYKTCIHDLFAAQALRTPNNVAVVHHGQSLSYVALDKQSSQLAQYMRAQGVAAGSRVALCAERSIGLIVGILATLKAGAAYVPLDPNYPAERLTYLLEDCSPTLLLTQGRGCEAVSTIGGCLLRLDIERDATVWNAYADTPLERIAGLDGHAPAYVMYTSGSTGTPKGVEVPHRAIARVVTNNGYADFNASDRIAFAANPAFDASTLELWAPLLNGGALIVIDQAVVLDPTRFAQTLREQAVTVMWLTVGLFNQYAVSLKAVIPQLRYLIVGGDVLDPGVIGWVMRECPPQHLLNGYGPTETTTFATTHAITAIPDGSIPIGRPIAQTQIYLLDAQRSLAPTGAVGEIYIGGAGVALGYLNRPELTAERFIDSPFIEGERLYKTGDLGRWLPDGTIEYCGRNDFQVKLRGFRIELGEIEARLTSHPDVRAAVVLVREDVPGDKRLVAYVTVEHGTEIASDALRSYLSGALPDYMVPAAYVTLASFPLNANGKVDRKALPIPAVEAYASRVYEAPVNATEQALAQIWSEVLKVERVGRQDHFFELGGHSLLAVMMTARVRNQLQREVQAKDVFAHPVLAKLATVIGQSQRSEQMAIVPVSRGQALPLSFAQQRLWFLAQMEGGSEAYHIPMALRLSGHLDRPALRRALDRLVARHEALRTSFVRSGDEPMQRIASADIGFALHDYDLRGDPAIAKAQTDHLHDHLHREARDAFDLEQGPLIRGRLLRLGDTEHVLAITMHHIVSDGWSMGVLADELSTLYRTYIDGKDDARPAIPVQYADYAVWQRQWLSGEVLLQQSAYWQKTLTGAPALLELPTDRPRPVQQRYAGDYVPVMLDAALTHQLKALAQRHGATVYMVMLAAWSVVLSRLSGQDDIVIGTPTANRARTEVEKLIGFFVNTLALRIGVAGSVDTLLTQVKNHALEAQVQQDLPFEQVVELINPPRSLSHTPIFQVMLAWQNNESVAIELAGLQTAVVDVASGAIKFDLELHLNEVNDGIVGELKYATALFDRTTIERHVGYLGRVLEAMANDSAQAVDCIDLLTPVERKQVLYDWNATAADYPQTQCIHQLVEAQAARTPDAMAVVNDGHAISYRDLNVQANQLSHHLIGLGVQPDNRVAICAERGIDMVVGVLAILKAGGAYVPLDPNYPADRLAYMVEDSAPVALLTMASVRSALPTLPASLPLIDLQDDASWRSGSVANPNCADLTAAHLAYIIYTSGSTGLPKGVMIEHRQAVNFLSWADSAFAKDAFAHSLFSTSLNFDLSVYECFAPLTVGGCVHVVSNALGLVRNNPPVHLINTVPSALQAMLDGQAIGDDVQVVNVAGEPLKRELAERLFATTKVRELNNLYGPSETTTYSSGVRMTRESGFISHIGKPIANTQFYLLDAHKQPVPTGVVGEIYIGGAGVARGYLNQDALTHERFLDNPFVMGERMYKTGDIGRWLADGSIDYRGRNDFQVKIRGFRIELGEIEARLAEYPTIREAVVLAREDSPGDIRLVAYLTTVDGNTLSSDALRTHLAGTLPDYMLPAAYVTLDALPLNPNGKLDRKALPAPASDAYITRDYEAPVGELETTLAQLWADLLKLDRVGRHDNFFELGGHSLLGVRLLSRIATTLGVEVSLGQLFVQPSLSGLAASVETLLHQAGPHDSFSISVVPREDNLPLSFAQQRLWFLAQLDARISTTYHIPLAMRLNGPLDRDALRRSLDTLWARHEALRTVFIASDDEPRIALLPAEQGLTLREDDLRDQPDPSMQLQQLCEEELHQPFDLAAGPLIRTRLIRLAEQDYQFLLTLHHITADGWSLGILWRDLGMLYRAYSEQQPNPLAPLAIQYPDYAVWQRKWLSGERLQIQADYWRANLADAPVCLALPTDRARPPQQSFAGAILPVHIDATLTQELKRVSRQHGSTLFITMMTAWAAVLARLSGQDDLVIGTPTANRNHAELEPLIGFFVNTLALRIDLSGEPSVAELLARVRRAALSAQEHQGLPFEQVVEILQPPRRLEHTPVFQQLFAWQNNDAGEFDLRDVQATPVDTLLDTAKFDIELHLGESDDGIVGAFNYATALFDAGTIERYRGYLLTMLRAMVTNTAQRIAVIDLLDDNERMLLQTWNATDAAYPDSLCIHQLFEQQVQRVPTSIALVHGEQSLDYTELNARANRLAHHLIAQGVRPDDRVAICVDRSLPMVVGLLAILKAGAAYVPLDPSYPAARLQQVMQGAQPAVLLCDAIGQRALGNDALQSVRMIDPSASIWTQPSKASPNPQVPGLTSQHLAYVIYTSGSTGTPKGVAMPHAPLVNLIHWQIGQMPPRRTLQFAALGFDVAFQEIFSTLCAGGELELIDADIRLDFARLFEHVCRRGIERLYLPYIALQALATEVAEGHHHDLPPCALREVITAGEQLRITPHIAALFDKLHGSSLHNHYGPTESHVATTYSTDAPVRQWMELPPIGRPIANARIYLLDSYGQPVPRGAAGELYIGGVAVARGYLHNDALTAARFLPDPFGGHASAQMYRTGDLARYLPDGNVEFLGRNDHQVKIRGFRIEPGEIEARLAEHPAVREAVVVVREDRPGDKRLVAYVTTQDSGSELVAALRTHISARVPDYMVPAAFVCLAAFPLSPNGKLDRKALPAPDADAYARRAYDPPQGQTEQVIAVLWEQLLGITNVSRHDNFFELGGHSLLAVRLRSRLSSTLDIALPLNMLFAHPSVASLAEAIDASALETKKPFVPAIVTLSREEPLPLSFAQQRLWFLAQLDGASATYNMPMALRFKGQLNRSALKRALDRIVWRHEVLRSCFRCVDDQPVQCIASPDSGLLLHEHDLRNQADVPAALVQRMREEGVAPFDMQHGPLIRGQLMQCADDEYMLAITMHHIVSDGWSMGVLIDELGTLYRAYCKGEHDPLPPLSVQYADFAVWQRQWLTGEVLQRQSEYWQRTLVGAPALLELPTDRPRPAQQTYAGDAVRVELDAALTRDLKALAQRRGMTLYMVVLAAWAAVLSRLSGQDDIVIGTPVANRTQADIEGLIGFFVNTQALRVLIPDTLAQLLDGVKQRALEAQEHQDLPFEQVVEIVNPPRSLSRTPIFQVMLDWRFTNEAMPELPALSWSMADPIYDIAKFDLGLDLGEVGDGIGGELSYATALFDRETIERQVGYLRALLTAMVTDEQQSVQRVALLGDAERHQLLHVFTDTRAKAEQPVCCVHTLIEAQAARRPDAPALVYGAQTLSYRELDQRANQLAHHLHDVGVQPDDRIAIYMERSIDMVVAILGVLKAGGGYLPLDPAYPVDRLTYMLDDAAPIVVLTQESLRASLPPTSATLLALDSAWPLIARQPSKPLSIPALRPDHLAYVIYTSGSTGLPKGVMVEHRQLVNLVRALEIGYALNERDRQLQFAALSFDMSVEEIFDTLCGGSALVLRTDAWIADAATFWRHCVENAISVLNLPTAFWHQLASERTVEIPAGIRQIMIGGDKISAEMVARWFQREGHRPRLINGYGPTEVTVDATTGEVVDAEISPRLIGRPILNTQIYILDAYGQPVPRGACGELYIGGDSVARGYLNRPEQTAERFLPDPFSSDPQARMYKTGDLGRFHADGQIEYLGRNDFQVKIRGFRIELGEIESRLAEHPAIREAVVLAREDQAGDRRLVAYVTLMKMSATDASDAAVDIEALRTHLGAGLPEYMVPAAYVTLPALPLTPNGKLDRKALPAPDAEAYTTRAYEAPVGEVENALAHIWAELLKLDRVGRQDSFFDLGGHSLLGITLISRLRRSLQIDITIKDLFAHPVLSALAQVVKDARHSEQSSIDVVPRDGTLPLSFAQQRLWFLAQIDGGSEAYHMPLALRLAGRLDVPALKRALDRVVARHEVLRTSFVREGDQTLQRIAAPACGFAWEQHDLRSHADIAAELRHRLRDEAIRPFDLQQGPLLRGQLLRCADDDHVLAVTMHHIVSDGWSLGIFTEEVSALYSAYSTGADDPLPPLAIQYADYAVWQRQWLTGEVLQRQSEYWKHALQGAPALLELPTDRPRPVRQDFAGAVVPVAIDATLTHALRRLSQRHGTTLYMIVLAAWAAVLSRLSGQDEVVIGTAIANRTRPEIEPLIGFFVNTQALRIRVEGTVKELLQGVKGRVLDAQDHQDLPFEQVVEIVQPPRSFAYAPIFQVVLAWQNTNDGELQLPGLELSAVDNGYEVAKFDLGLDLSEMDDGIAGHLFYATALFDHVTMERHVMYLHQLLHAMVADDHQTVATIDLLGDSERAALLALGSGGPSVQAVPDFRHGSLYDLVIAQALRTPDATAVVEPGRDMSYRQLAQQANGLAWRLRELGAAPEARVALLADRSIESLVGLLGILAAGAAYVPIDPSYPDERMAYVLNDAAVLALVTPSTLLAQANTTLQWRAALEERIIDVGTVAPNDSAPLSGVGEHNAAYVIYTSGSTGVPKGVAVEQRGVMNFVQGFVATHPFENQRLLMIPPLVFDASVGDVFPALAVGSTLVLHPAPTELGAAELEQFCHEQRITAIDAPAALWRRWTEALSARAGDAAVLPHLSLLMFGGESVSVELVHQFARLTDNRVMLVNHYGPTEASVCATILATRDGAELRGTELSIGRPLPGVQVYVLGADLQLLPRGVEGELCIGGVGVARGYLGNPELTAKQFVRDPFSTDTQAMLYRTGDRVRWNNDGSLQFLGRGDFQVKIRGMRIELSEIEVRLAQHPAVQEAAVLAREDSPGDKRLVAYIVVTDAKAASIDSLRTHLKATLPDYMVPAAYVTLAAFPLTTNGKLDRKALPAPAADAYVTREYMAPQDAAEHTLATIWADVLKLERVGREDHFFELGGHSLLAVTLIERMRRAGLHVDVRTLFAAPILKDLAAAAATEQRTLTVPPNLIPPGCVAITPAMLPLVSLRQSHIDTIVAHVDGGAENVQDIYPLAPMQEGFLFHHLLEKEGDVYLAPSLYTATSREQLRNHAEALQAVIDRHDILRTAILWEDLPEPVQVVWRHAPLAVEYIELDPVDGDIAEQLGARFDPRHYRLDIRQAPLWRWYVAEDAPNHRWVVMQLMHHMSGDHVSLEVLQREMETILRGHADALPVPLPFRNFVAQTRFGLSKAEHETFFRGMLGDIDESTAPFGLTDVQGDGSRIVEVNHDVDLALSRRVRARARALGVSAATLCHVAWAMVLARACGRDDVVFGTVMLGRMQGGEGVDRMMGTFINTLPLRIRLGEQGAQASVLATHASLTELFKHEHAPLVLAQRCSAVRAGVPLFTTMLNYRYMESAGDALDDAAAEDMAYLGGNERANYPFNISINDLGEGFSFNAQVDASIDAQRICAMLQTALDSLATALEQSPDTPICHLDVLPAAERQQVLHAWNDTVADYPQAPCIHELIQAQVLRQPDAPALHFDGKTLSYAELNLRANRLAHYLISLHVQPDDRVAICMERSLNLVVGLLGILKAGAGYVPLDPSYPAERLSYMLENSEPAVLLTQHSLLERTESWRAQTDKPVLMLDSDDLDRDEALVSQPTHNPAVSGLNARRLAYVIYTSGSTGRPKGVMNEHRGVVNRLLWAQSQFELLPHDRVLQKTPCGFDVSVWEFFLPLLAGAQLVLAKPGGHQDPDYLAALIQHEHITVAHFVPSMLQLFLTQTDPSRCGGLRHVLCSGEALPYALQTRCMAMLQDTALHNLYGPTEAAVDVTYWRCDNALHPGVVPIGRPVANTQMYVLDSHREPVPAGVAGELYIGGIQVARGYLHRAELTAERFVPDPFAHDNEARMYKTGDLGRWLPDGSIEYLGRNDFQVKIRGFRIELGEIEAMLAASEGVRDAAVIAREDAHGDKRLIAYLVLTSEAIEAGDRVANLRVHLGAQLPEYMVPSAFVVLDSFPLTPNGKLDRQALPAPEGDAYVRRVYAPPQGEIEVALAKLWQDLLGIEQVSRHDNFFELGGHSLLAIQLLNGMRQLLGVKVGVRDLFAHPVLDAMAQLVVFAHEIVPTSIDLAAEAVLDPTIHATQPFQKPLAPQHIFLTGASGFLGVFLLSSLLSKTPATVHCLLRCRSEEQGLRRLQENLHALGLPHVDAERVVIVPGDLSAPLLGLTAQRFEQLAQNMDAIYHNGAWVNFLHPYESLKSANVLGTQEVLRMAARGKPKEIHYISTISVVQHGTTDDSIVTEEQLFEHWQGVSSGYVQSKWVAEKLLRIGMTRGMPITIYRPGNICGSTTLGASNASDTWSLFIDACLELGCAPDIDGQINMLPVDYLSDCIVELSLRDGHRGSSLNLMHTDPVNLRDLVDGLVSMDELSIERVPYAQWLTRCAANPATMTLTSLLPADDGEETPQKSGEPASEQTSEPARAEISLSNALVQLNDEGLAYPRMSPELLGKYIAWRHQQRTAASATPEAVPT